MLDKSPEQIAKSYDEIPYDSYPFRYSHPANMFTIGQLFGLKAAPIEKAKILELGCSSGGNIIPIAMHYPDSKILGIDFSKTEIEMGKDQIQSLKLENIELRKQSILEFSKKEGKFDYIICHGVFSWVDEEVQEKILNICKDNLKKNGIAYVSYNALPGWNMLKSIRELMMFHTQNLEDPKEKVKQARGILKFITNGLSEDTSPYAQFLKQEIKVIENQTDSYILHEHLSHYNKPFYFNEFIKLAMDHDLSYLSDAILSSMYSENLPKNFSDELKKVKNMIATNQYMDFIRNNRFRSTLLCHKGAELQRSLRTDSIRDYYMRLTARIQTNELSQEDLSNDKELVFQLGGIKMKTTQPDIKAVLVTLYRNRFEYINYKTLFEQVKEIVKKPDGEIDMLLQVEANLFRMALAGLIEISSHPSQHTLEISEKPVACPLVRYQAAHHSFVTNRHHQYVTFDNIEKIMISLLDGEHTKEQIYDALHDKLQSGELTILDNEKKPLADTEQTQNALKEVIEKTLIRFARSAILIK